MSLIKILHKADRKNRMKQNNEQLVYEKTFKNFILGIISLTTFNYILGMILYHSYPSIIERTIFIGIVLNIFAFVVVYCIPQHYIKKLIPGYLFAMISLLFINSISVMSFLPTIIPLLYYIVIPIPLYVIYPWKSVVKWAVLILFLMVTSCVLSYLSNYHFRDIPYEDFFKYPYLDTHRPFKLTMMPNILAVLFSFLIICYTMYYVHRIHEIKIRQLMNLAVVTEKEEKADGLEISDEKEIKYEKIYLRIMAYFEDRQPYLRPEFTLANMASDLNINTAYLSKVISIKGNMNFNQFVNFYRINKVKEMIRNNPQYTLQYIYLSSGFNSQSSFNKAFKLQEGITPSEYASRINHPEGV
jgi:AraC-like DNA-binding protein